MHSVVQLPTKHIILDLKAEDRIAAYDEILRHLVQGDSMTEEMQAEILELLSVREMQTTFAMGKNIAIPHVNGFECQNSLFVYARSLEGIEFGSCDSGLVNHIILAIIPVEEKCGWLKILSQTARTMTNKDLRDNLLEASTPEGAQTLLVEAFEGPPEKQA